MSVKPPLPRFQGTFILPEEEPKTYDYLASLSRISSPDTPVSAEKIRDFVDEKKQNCSDGELMLFFLPFKGVEDGIVAFLKYVGKKLKLDIVPQNGVEHELSESQVDEPFKQQLIEEGISFTWKTKAE